MGIFGLKYKKRGKYGDGPEDTARFKALLNELGKKDDYYPTAVKIAKYCDEGVRIARQRMMLTEKIRILDEKLNELDAYSNLNDEDADALKKLLDRFMALSRERNELIYQLTGFDNALTYMEKLEGDAAASVGDIADAEKQQRVLRRDVGHLEGEKAELEYEKEFLNKGVLFIYRFTAFIVALFGVVAIILGYLYLFRGASIFFPLSIFILLLIFVVFLLYAFRRRMVYELRMNHKKQQRAVDLLNTKNAVYAHYTNYLNFTYKKYKIKNSQMLSKNLRDLNNYKHLAYRFDNIRSIMYQTETQIEEFLRVHRLGGIKSTVEQFAKTVNIDNKREYYRELSAERQAMEENLTSLEKRHGEIWEIVHAASLHDHSGHKILSRMLTAYQNEIETLEFNRETAFISQTI